MYVLLFSVNKNFVVGSWFSVIRYVGNDDNGGCNGAKERVPGGVFRIGGLEGYDVLVAWSCR